MVEVIDITDDNDHAKQHVDQCANLVKEESSDENGEDGKDVDDRKGADNHKGVNDHKDSNSSQDGEVNADIKGSEGSKDSDIKIN